MKKNLLLVVVGVICLGSVLSSCTSTEILTPSVIESDLAGVQYLAGCQFYISTDVTLTFMSDNRETTVRKEGVIEAQRVITRRTIKIDNETPGILQTKNSKGEKVSGYRFAENKDGKRILVLSILFDENDDNVIEFTAVYNNSDDKFQLLKNEVNYSGLIYKITYDGRELPYLLYEISEDVKEDNDQRKVKGRKIGD